MATVPLEKLPQPWQVSDQRQTVLVLRNPKAGPRDRSLLVEHAVRALRRAGWQVEQCDDRQEFVDLANNSAFTARLRCVVPAGGDGTSTLAATYLTPQIPLAPLCVGNENVMARWVGYSGSCEQLLHTIRHGRAVTLDAGQADGRLFLFVLTAGFDAQVVHLMHRRRRGHAGHSAYVAPLLRTLIRYRYPPVHLRNGSTSQPADSTAWQAPWVFVFNMPCYAMRIPVCRHAMPADGLLDVCTFPPRSLAGSLCYLALILLGRHAWCRGARHVQLQEVRLESDVPIAYQMDGDPGGHLPVSISVCPQRWSILLPTG
ncbi:MAG: protein BmrU [Pirellulaceae bacterium]|nr:MAG: protein BmrU [Pirellulaceae bacterium]